MHAVENCFYQSLFHWNFPFSRTHNYTQSDAPTHGRTTPLCVLAQWNFLSELFPTKFKRKEALIFIKKEKETKGNFSINECEKRKAEFIDKQKLIYCAARAFISHIFHDEENEYKKTLLMFRICVIKKRQQQQQQQSRMRACKKKTKKGR